MLFGWNINSAAVRLNIYTICNLCILTFKAGRKDAGLKNQATWKPKWIYSKFSVFGTPICSKMQEFREEKTLLIPPSPFEKIRFNFRFLFLMYIRVYFCNNFFFGLKMTILDWKSPSQDLSIIWFYLKNALFYSSILLVFLLLIFLYIFAHKTSIKGRVVKSIKHPAGLLRGGP